MLWNTPNKPLLLLAVLDLFAQGSIAGDLVELTPELGEMFAGSWSRVTLVSEAQAQVFSGRRSSR